MRKVLCAFLALAVLMPSLACAMPLCADSASRAGKASLLQAQPCSDHHAPAGQTGQPEGVDFNLDCMGVDLQKAESSILAKPGLKPVLAVFLPQASFVTGQAAQRSGTARAPDFLRINLSPPYHSVLLTSQRLRI